MPAQADIVIADGAAAAKTFKAAGVTNGVATFLEKTAATVAGFFRLTMSMRMSLKPNEPIRHQMKLVIPTVVTETINGVAYNKVVRQSMADISVVIAPDSTLAERKDVVEFISRMCRADLANSGLLFYNQVVNNDPTT